MTEAKASELDALNAENANLRQQLEARRLEEARIRGREEESQSLEGLRAENAELRRQAEAHRLSEARLTGRAEGENVGLRQQLGESPAAARPPASTVASPSTPTDASTSTPTDASPSNSEESGGRRKGLWRR